MKGKVAIKRRGKVRLSQSRQGCFIIFRVVINPGKKKRKEFGSVEF